MAARGPGYTELPDNVAQRDWHLVSNDEYFYQNIVRSWKASGMKEVTLQLKKYEWLRAKIWGAGVGSLLEDFEAVEKEDQLKTLATAMRLSRCTLRRCCWELPSQLYGRLETSTHGAAVSVCAGIERRSEALAVNDFYSEHELWLRPLFHSGLQLPDGIPVNNQTADMHTKAITCLLFFGDGKLASGSEDGLVKVWDLDSGHCTATLPHKGVGTLVFGTDGCLFSASQQDRLIMKWTDLEKCIGAKQAVMERPPKKEKTDVAGQDQYVVALVKTGAIMDVNLEPVRDAVILYNRKDEDQDTSKDPYRLVYMCCDDQRPIMASWTHDCEVRQTLIGEYDGCYIAALGDVKGNVVILRVERYTPLSAPKVGI